MLSENVAAGAQLLGIGTVLCAVSFPLTKDLVKPNHFYGIRLPKSYESQENWFKMNRYGGKQLIKWGLVMVACGVVALFLPLQSNVNLRLFLSLLPALLLFVPVLQIIRYSKTI